MKSGQQLVVYPVPRPMNAKGIFARLRLTELSQPNLQRKSVLEIQKKQMNTLLNRFASPGFLVGYALLLILPVIASRAAVTTDSLGWTVVTPSADSIIV